jgi:hypothetical protein
MMEGLQNQFSCKARKPTMKFAHSLSANKTEKLVDLACELQEFVDQAAADGEPLYEIEKGVLAKVLRMGHLGIDRFLQRQGDGDLGPTVQTADGVELQRSESPIGRPLRTVFGEHSFDAYVYAPGPKQKIALRPIDARLNLPAGKYSYLLEEFTQYFCVEQAFGQAADSFQTVLGQKLPVDTLERTNHRVGEQARDYLDALPKPAVDEEGGVLVATADGKGVPLIRDNAQTPPVHGPKPSRPGNRRMATLACVYSVDPYVRSAQDVVAALFRDKREEKAAARPQPCHKRMTACFSTVEEVGSEDELTIRGDFRAWSWAAEQIRERRVDGQALVRLCDGQESLWNAADVCLGLDDKDDDQKRAENVVDILDVIHVSGYVWSAGRALYGKSESKVESFVRDRLLRILQGQAPGVIRGIRRMATEHGLGGQKLQDATKACNYLENNLDRMRYDEYLAAGYPIASGVIEGACRHLVKDRMERTGMRWREPSAGSMLFVRALEVTDLWEPFQVHRQAAERERLHPHRQLLDDYTPDLALAG